MVTKNEEKYLLDVSSNNSLALSDNKRIKNLSDLVSSLKTMSDEVFGYHVNFQRNDFSHWIPSPSCYVSCKVPQRLFHVVRISQSCPFEPSDTDPWQ